MRKPAQEPQTVNSISVGSAMASSPDAAGSEAAGAATPAHAASSVPDVKRAEFCKKRRLLSLCDCMWVSFACGYDIGVRPVGGRPSCVRCAPAKKSGQAACAAMSYPARIESILCKRHNLSNLCRGFHCSRFSETHRAARKDKKSPPQGAAGRETLHFSMSLANRSALQPAQCTPATGTMQTVGSPKQ